MDFIELGEEQAKVFAYWYFLLRQPEQAAQKAGVQDGVLLLGDRRVRRELRRLRREFAKQGAGELAKLGLCRLLFAQAERDEEGNPVFDGFSAERFGTGKGMEYKAWDKLKACELLLRLAERERCCRRCRKARGSWTTGRKRMSHDQGVQQKAAGADELVVPTEQPERMRRHHLRRGGAQRQDAVHGALLLFVEHGAL